VSGRFSLYEETRRLADRFRVDEVTIDDVPARWNVAPTQPVLVVATSRDGRNRRLGQMRWGLVPTWARDPSIGNRLINARGESLHESRAFAKAYATRRCLVPASGFYEWQDVEHSTGRSRRRPFHIHGRDGAPLALGGLWEVWRDAEGKALRTCTIVTTGPNALLVPIHGRMPVVLGEHLWDRWLAPEPLCEDDRTVMLAPAPDGLLVATPVGVGVNDPRNEGPELIEPRRDR
jgi:putative SOS response-associated peptidase YedK